MLHFPVKIICPYCQYMTNYRTMNYCVHTDALPGPEAKVTVRCPSHGGPFTLHLATLKQADACPPDAVPLPLDRLEPPPTPPPAKRRWFGWW